MKRRILLVDDDRQLNKINERVLVTSGLASEVHIATNGREAINYLRIRDEKHYPLPDLIIFDLKMPVMDGFQFIDEFQRMNLNGKSEIMPVVFTSSYSPKDKQRAISKGIRYYLTKPYLLRELFSIIRNMYSDKGKSYPQNTNL